nr:inositol monophosphatase [Solirubrobacterales bacterium]
WDVAAGRLLCERAGLVVRDLPAAGDDAPLGILVAPPGLVDELAALIDDG